MFAGLCVPLHAADDPAANAPSQSSAAGAQATDPPTQATQSSEQSADTLHQAQTGTSNGRLLFALPNFLTVGSDATLPPLTVKQKFAVVARSAFDYAEFPWYGAIAGISQAENSEPAYGQGAVGYAKRYGTEFADGTIENFWVSAIVPSVLHQDPRFYQMPNGSFAHRALYAGSRILVTRGDSGHRRFNFSEVFGAMFAAVISTYSYHPKSEKTVANTASVWGTEMGYDTITIEIKEFWPDLQRKFSRHKSSPAEKP
ncbi:MAG TPA: hypothetical protein VMB47_19410 [Candidatus Aquilonibacter sp.]|nr:hypothetical protein [Candidatus Aquilonibacter sp.]